MNENERTPRSSQETPAGSLSVLRRGLRESPDLKSGLRYTVWLGLAMTVGRVVVPVLIQQVLDRGLPGNGHGFRRGLVYVESAVAAAIILLVYVAARATYRRMIRASESSLAVLRVRAFRHIHALSMAEQTAGR